MKPFDTAKAPKILRVDASMRRSDSVTRLLSDEVVAELTDQTIATSVTTRDLADPLPFVTEAWIGANFTPPEERTAEQRAILAKSDALVSEVADADVLVIGVPIYNFGVPAALKAWIDLICRARLTFEYTADGPRGLLTGKRAYLIVASGGTEAGSAIDFATGYLRHVLGFIGIDDVTIIDASASMRGADAALARARGAIRAMEADRTIRPSVAA